MTSKITLGAIVAIAFLAGTITTGTGVFAADHRDAPLLGTAWHSILDKIDALEARIVGIMDNLNDDLRALDAAINTEESSRIAADENLQQQIDGSAGLSDQLEALRCNNIGHSADLNNCDLSGDNLTNAYLFQGNFSSAILDGVSFFGADLVAADFRGADISGANFDSANLGDADFTGAINQPTGDIDCIGTPIGAEFTCNEPIS